MDKRIHEDGTEVPGCTLSLHGRTNQGKESLHLFIYQVNEHRFNMHGAHECLGILVSQMFGRSKDILWVRASSIQNWLNQCVDKEILASMEKLRYLIPLAALMLNKSIQLP